MRKHLVAAAVALVVASGALAAGAGAATVTPVASGLDSPRGLAFLPNGTLMVAEAGHGGDVCFPDGTCAGTSGRVSAIDVATGAHSAVATGLISALDPEGGAIGIDGLSAQGGRLLGIVGVYPEILDGASCAHMPADCASVLAAGKAQLGQLVKFTPSGVFKPYAGVGSVDVAFTAANPGGPLYGTEVDANPYGLLALPGGTYVADAGANTLDWVGNDGDISILHRFPVPDPLEPFPTDAVPTCVALTPSGRLYVGDLSGRIWSVSGTSASLVSGQLDGRHFTGCAADGAGNVYFVSMFAGLFPNPGTGSVVKLASSGSQSTVASHLVLPNGITIAPSGALYVSVNSICGASPGGPCGPLTGGVVRITP